MARKLYSFTNTVKFKLDLPSWRKLKKDSQKLGKELGDAPTASMVKASRRQERELIASRTKLADKLRREDAKIREQNKRQAAKDSKAGFQSSIAGLTETSGLKASQTVFAEKMRQEDALAKKQQAGMDSHVKLMRKRNMEQEKFERLQASVIKRFSISNKEIREMGELERRSFIAQLKQAKTKDELLFTERKLKAEIADRLRNEKRLTQEKNKQTLAQRRLTSSTEQMVGALASVYTGVAAGQAIVSTGMEFQSIEKSFLVVSGSAEKAAENMAFARSEAMRLGGPIIDLSQSYARMLAAAGDKMAIDDLKTLFTGVNESAVALGLNQDKISRIMLAIQQMMSKNKIMAEELTGQLGESLPFALRAMTTAAAKAGLIDGTLSQQKQEAALRKLMENGKLIASEVLPNFGKELQRLANDGNALQRALDENLGPALGRARNTLQELMVSVFKGLSPALKSILDSFTEVGEGGHNLAKTLGTTVGAALMGLTFPIAMLTAGILDLMDIFKEVTGLSDETANKFWTFASVAAGLTFGLIGLFKILKFLKGGFTFLTKGAQEISKASGTASKAMGTLKTGALGVMKVFSRLFWLISSVMTVWDARPGGDLSATSLFGENAVTKFLDTPVTQLGKGQNKTPEIKLDVKVGVDENGNLNPYIMGRMEEYNNEMLMSTYNNYSPSN